MNGSVPVGTAEIKRWVLQPGAEVELLGPKGLREEVGKELDAASTAYRTPGSSRTIRRGII